jgi:uncharacterized protein involved in response to NO
MAYTLLLMLIKMMMMMMMMTHPVLLHTGNAVLKLPVTSCSSCGSRGPHTATRVSASVRAQSAA